jgi:enoyl-CoA hydratase/carnithine racemase
MAKSTILTEHADVAAIIKFNRPEKRNALTQDMMTELAKELEKAADDPSVRAIILAGEGKCFCSGVDFNMLAELGGKAEDTAAFRRIVTKLQAVGNLMESIEKPVIALLHCYCLGMGLEVALAADFRIAAEGTQIGLPETELGLIPDVGGTTRLTRTVGIPRAKELIMLSRIIDARRAYEIGLVNEVVPESELMAAAMKWVAQLKNCAPLAVGLAKKIIDRGAHLDKLTLMELELLAQSILLKTDDVNEGVMARMQKRRPDFKSK